MIEKGQKVSVEYTLTLDDGTVADTNVGNDPLVYEQGANQILPALEEKIAELDVEQSAKVTLPPEDGYGVKDPEALVTVEAPRVPEEGRQVGQILAVSDAQGGQRPVRVHEINDDEIILDFNHPLAGENLHFDVKVVGID
jgi:FKBP-type peptidyl-prolyl cis-trans isomerase 2